MKEIKIQNFMSSSGSGTVINYGSGSGSTSQKVTVPTVPVPVPQHWLFQGRKGSVADPNLETRSQTPCFLELCDNFLGKKYCL
jgi:hypothetical protein